MGSRINTAGIILTVFSSLLSSFLLLGCDQTPIGVDLPPKESAPVTAGLVSINDQGDENAKRSFQWPPTLNQVYPDFQLMDAKGRSVMLSDYRGFVLLVEAINMSCPGCLVFGGDNVAVAHNNQSSIDEQVNQYAGLSADDERLKLVQILFYGPTMDRTRVHHIQQWQDQMGHEVEQALLERLILVPAMDLRSEETLQLTSGYQLLDKDGILRFDATGSRPVHSLRDELLPAIADYAARLSRFTGTYSLEWGDPSSAPEEGEAVDTVFQGEKKRL